MSTETPPAASPKPAPAASDDGTTAPGADPKAAGAASVAAPEPKGSRGAVGAPRAAGTPPRAPDGKFVAAKDAGTSAKDAGTSASPRPLAGTASAGADTATASTAGETSHASDPAKPTDKPDPKLSKAWATVLEKEAAVVETKKALDEQRKAIEAEKASIEAVRQWKADIEKAKADGKRMRVLELVGMTLDEVQDEYLTGLREPTPEELAQREEQRLQKLVDDRLAAEKKAREEAETKQREESEKTAAEANAKAISDWQDAAERTFVEKAAEFPALARYNAMVPEAKRITSEDVWARSCTEAQRRYQAALAEGKSEAAAAAGAGVSQLEALRLIEADLAKDFAPAPPAPKEEPKTEADRPRVKARDTAPRALTSRDAGEVPLSPTPVKQGRSKSAWERLEEAKREHGVS